MTGPQGGISQNDLLAYHHGELSAEDAGKIAERLKDDPEARALLRNWQEQDAALGTLFSPVLHEPLPERLTAVPRPARKSALPFAHRLPIAARVAAVLAVFVLGGLAGWSTARIAPQMDSRQPLARSAVAAHETFVVEVAHPVEVEAEQAAHLTGWVSKRLGHEIAPPDFAAEGFQLMGGRVLPAEAGAAALFMYENGSGRRVSLYVAPASQSGETAFQFAEYGNTQTFFWIDGSLTYAVVGDLPRETLRKIALAAYDQLI